MEEDGGKEEGRGKVGGEKERKDVEGQGRKDGRKGRMYEGTNE
jgi:hypothetical protein